MARDVNIDVKVYVNPAGKVDYSEVLSNVVEADRDLAALAMFSARRWEFVPARSGDEAVPGEVILHYQFGPGVRPAGNPAVAER
jgi:outer membrane biosynthesis protein TonB